MPGEPQIITDKLVSEGGLFDRRGARVFIGFLPPRTGITRALISGATGAMLPPLPLLHHSIGGSGGSGANLADGVKHQSFGGDSRQHAALRRSFQAGLPLAPVPPSPPPCER